jgi:hypothetical protein
VGDKGVADGGNWDSKVVTSSKSFLVKYAGPPRESEGKKGLSKKMILISDSCLPFSRQSSKVYDLYKGKKVTPLPVCKVAPLPV